jgi:isoquinoline 1-oxidoreductase beta subunit
VSGVVTRRDLLAALGLTLGGLALGITGGRAHAVEPVGPIGPQPDPASPAEEARAAGLNPNVFLHVALDGAVTIVCHRSEMGQGVRSTIPVLLADELGADLARVVVRQAEGDARYGDQNTDGSSSIRKPYENLRRAGATARVMLVTAAARRWKVDPGSCTTRAHQVVHTATGRTLPFSELVAAAAKVPVPEDAPLRPFAELVHVNAERLPLLDGPALVDGSAVFGADIRLPGMLVAVIARPPVVGGKLVRFEATGALAVPGVQRVIEMPAPAPPWRFQPWGGVAVLGDTTWAAMRGRAQLELQWEAGDNASYDSEAYRESLLAAVRAPGATLRDTGDIDAAFAGAAKVLEAEYTVPHLAHLTMEPPVAVARVAEGRCEIWTSTQHPQAVRKEVAEMLGLPLEAVRVNVTLLGGGFGRKSKADFAREAAFLAQQAGVPVRVQWTRDDDIRHGYYNTVNAQRLRAALDGDGRVVAWHHRTAFPPISATHAFPPAPDPDLPTANDLQQGVLDLVLAVPNVRAEACAARSHVRVGWYRSVYNIFHAFAISSFLDEIAHARGQDPRDGLLEVIGPARVVGLQELGIEKLANYGAPLEEHPVDAGRLRHVIERVTEAARWSDRKSAGRALGLAAHRSFLSYAAAVVSVVRKEGGGFSVDEAWISLDAGTVINRERVVAQLEGAVIMGLSNAMYGGITLTGGAVRQSNFRDARILRIGEAPRAIHVDVVPSDFRPCGVGEPGVPPVAPALANALFALTGERLRSLPLVPLVPPRALPT